MATAKPSNRKFAARISAQSSERGTALRTHHRRNAVIPKPRIARQRFLTAPSRQKPMGGSQTPALSTIRGA